MELPHLHSMMSSYFHQDYDLSGLDDEAILKSYAGHRVHGVVMSIIREIEQLLSIPTEGLLVRFEGATGHGNMTIGKTYTEARMWLQTSYATLKSFAAPGD